MIWGDKHQSIRSWTKMFIVWIGRVCFSRPSTFEDLHFFEQSSLTHDHSHLVVRTLQVFHHRPFTLTDDFPLGTFVKVFDSEMSEQLDMMSEFCYGPDAFQNSGISHSYVRVSIITRKFDFNWGLPDFCPPFPCEMWIKDMCNDLLKEFVSNMNGVNRNEAGDGIYWIQTVKNKLEKSIVHLTHQNGAF